MSITGIVLAGGLSRRFGKNKLTHIYKGKPVIAYAVEALRHIADEVIIAVSEYTRHNIEGLGLDAKIIVDTGSCQGPLRGMATAAQYARSNWLLVVPGDSPWLKPEPLKRLIDYAKKHNATTTSPLWGNNTISPLHVYTTRELAKNLDNYCRVRRELARPTDLHRSSPKLLLVGAGLLGSPHSLRTLNTPKDLEEVKPPAPTTTRTIVIEEQHALLYHKATKLLASRDNDKAAELYKQEARIYINRQALHLALHTLMDVCNLKPHQQLRETVASLREKLGLKPRHHKTPTC